MNHIFVDTWAWYALADKTDISHHLVASVISTIPIPRPIKLCISINSCNPI